MSITTNWLNKYIGTSIIRFVVRTELGSLVFRKTSTFCHSPIANKNLKIKPLDNFKKRKKCIHVYFK